MEFIEDTPKGNYLIRAYAPGKIVINENTIEHNIIVTPWQLIDPWAITSAADLNAHTLAPLLSLSPLPDLILLGVGNRCVFPPQELLLPFQRRNIGVEVMTTAAACRTYSALLAEGRQVAAALIV